MTRTVCTYITSLFAAISITISLQAQHVMKIQSGINFSTTGGVVITLKDIDLDNDGTFIQTAGQGVVVFSGSANNHISGSSSLQLDALQLEKTGSGKVTLEQDISIVSTIKFGGGILDLNNNNILLSPIASLVDESETTHITGKNGGYVQFVTPLAAPAAANPGNLGVEITSTLDLGSVTIRRGHQSQSNSLGNGMTVFRYYDIIPTNNTALNATLRFHYLDAELNNLDENRLTKWTSSDNLYWTNLGFAVRHNVNNYVEQGGINSLYRFTLTETSNALPLRWGSFNTQCISGQTKVTWKTLQEQNTSGFIVRRSTDGRSWIKIGNVPAAGNSQTTLSYSYTDPQASTGITYYQVLQEDLDGRQTLSPVLVSECASTENIKVYPIPAKNNCWVSIQSERTGTISMHLYTIQGALLKQQAVNIQSGNNVFEFPLANYPAGVYSLAFTWSDGKVKVIRLEKL